MANCTASCNFPPVIYPSGLFNGNCPFIVGVFNSQVSSGAFLFNPHQPATLSQLLRRLSKLMFTRNSDLYTNHITSNCFAGELFRLTSLIISNEQFN